MKSRKANAVHQQPPPTRLQFSSSRQINPFPILLGFSLFVLITVIAQPLRGQGYWTGWISEEQDTIQARPGYYLAFVSDETGVAVAPQGYLISGLKCWNDYCDHVALEIAQNRDANLLVDRSKWKWTPWLSEESHKNYYVAPEGWFIIGYVCSGSYCDDRRFMIAPLLPGQNARCDN